LCDDRLEVLSKDLPHDELKKKWLDIYQEYVDTVCFQSEKDRLQVIANIQLLQFRITKATAIHKYLTIQEEAGREFDPGIIDTLKYMGVYSGTTLHLKKLVGQIKQLSMDLQREEKAFSESEKRIQKAGTTVTKTSRESFQDFIVQIEEYVKFPIKESETSVARFMAMVKKYLAHCAYMEKEYAKMQTK